MTIRVLLADDQALFREAVAAMLARDGRLEIVGSVDSGDAAIAFVRAHAVDVILMDIRMPGTDGIAATREVLRLRPQTRVLVLTTFDLDEYIYEALRVGASGFVLKDDPPEQLIAAIRTVAAGDALLSPAVTKRVIERFTRIPRPSAPPGLEDLTARELEVLRLVAQGLSNEEIGQHLFIGETTVKTHVTHVLQKLDLRDRVQAVVLAHQAGLFEDD